MMVHAHFQDHSPDPVHFPQNVKVAEAQEQRRVRFHLITKLLQRVLFLPESQVLLRGFLFLLALDHHRSPGQKSA